MDPGVNLTQFDAWRPLRRRCKRFNPMPDQVPGGEDFGRFSPSARLARYKLLPRRSIGMLDIVSNLVGCAQKSEACVSTVSVKD